jgi:hypothetical protein
MESSSRWRDTALVMPDLRKMFEQLVDAYNDRDPDAFAAHWNPDCEWHPVLARP